MGEWTRAFLALALPLAARSEVSRLLERMRERPGAADVKWVAPGNLHVTLRFLGDLAPADLERARALVRGVDRGFREIPTAWTQLGAFPSRQRAQVIWLGLADERGELGALAREFETRLGDAGFGPADKPFRAHVTLGRVRRGRRVDWGSLSDGLTMPAAAFSIRTTALFKSTLTGGGPIYTVLESAAAEGGHPPPADPAGTGMREGE